MVAIVMVIILISSSSSSSVGKKYECNQLNWAGRNTLFHYCFDDGLPVVQQKTGGKRVVVPATLKKERPFSGEMMKDEGKLMVGPPPLSKLKAT